MSELNQKTQPGIAQGFTNQGKCTPDNLIAGEYPRVARYALVKGGLPVGAVLGQIGQTGEFVLSTTAATDGSEKPQAILAESVPESEGFVQAHVYLSGQFNGHALTVGEGHTLESVIQKLQMTSVFIRNNQP